MSFQAEIDAINAAYAAQEEKAFAEALRLSEKAERERIRRSEELVKALRLSEEAERDRRRLKNALYESSRVVRIVVPKENEEEKMLAAALEESLRFKNRGDASEQKQLEAAIASSIKTEAERNQYLSDEVIARIASRHDERTRLDELKSILYALEPSDGEVAIMCPWCSKPQVLLVNCGIAYCGMQRTNGVLNQIAPHSAGLSSAVEFGCGKQFKYDRTLKTVSKCSGL